MIWFRQIYMPGMRGALLVLIVNLLILLTIKIVTVRMAHAALHEHKRFVAKPVHRRLAHAHVFYR